LSEFTHVEAELDFIRFGELLDHLEQIITSVVETVLADKEIAGFIHTMNPSFQKPSAPFLRMSYLEAIDWLNAQDPPILNEEDKPHVFGDDIAEAAERKMTDTINKPILLHSFPAALKSFYVGLGNECWSGANPSQMKKDPKDSRLTESVDLLFPGVGEIVGGSMRMEGFEELMDAYARHGLVPDNYYWYNDQRK
jgi:asparaginyl-tRNA synthetase